MSSNQDGAISSLDGKPLKLADQFIYLGSHISSMESYVNTHKGKSWIATDRLMIILKSDLSNKIKQEFFQALAVSILLYDWTLTKCPKKKLDSNDTRILYAVLNKSWKQHFTKQQLYCHLPPILQLIQEGYNCCRSKNKLISVSNGLRHMDTPVLADQ